MHAIGRKQHSELSFFTTGDGCQIAYRFDGAVGQPVLVLSNSIGTDLHMWDGQIEPLSRHFRVLRYDARGHGASDAPAEAYSMDRLVLEASDLSETAATFLANWFPSSMLEAGSPVVGEFRSGLLATHPQGFAGSYAAVRDADLRRTVALIKAPTLVIAGRYDTVTSLGHGELLAATVPGARLLVLPAVHLSNVEYPAEFMVAVLEFLGAR